LYFLTAQRGAGWQDSGMFQWRVLTGDYAGQLGLALAHPLYIAAGRLLNLCSTTHLPLLLNAFSGLGMAVALANLAVVIHLLTHRAMAGFLIAAMLGTAHAAWFLSTVAEVYTWSVAGLTTEFLLLVLLIQRKQWPYAVTLALVSGLGWCIHNFALLPLPVYILVVIVMIARKQLPLWSILAAAGAYILGAGMYLAMIVQLAATHDVLFAIRSALFGNYEQQVLNVGSGSKHFKENMVLSAMSFLNLLLPLAMIGWWVFRKRLGQMPALAFTAITAIEILFFIRYPVPDQFTFILPSLVLIALAAGIGLAAVMEKSRHVRRVLIIVCLLSIVLQPVIYALLPGLVRRAGMEPQRDRKLPYRDELSYWTVPWKHHETSAERFAREALIEARPDGILVSDSTAWPALLVVQKTESLQQGVSVQYQGQPLPLGTQDAEGFLRAADNRPIYTLNRPTFPVPGEFIQKQGKLLEQFQYQNP
jgi:hypothetical protein